MQYFMQILYGWLRVAQTLPNILSDLIGFRLLVALSRCSGKMLMGPDVDQDGCANMMWLNREWG